MLNKLIAEATEIDFKVALEVKKPKSWLKSVSAFAKGSAGCYVQDKSIQKRLACKEYGNKVSRCS